MSFDSVINKPPQTVCQFWSRTHYNSPLSEIFGEFTKSTMLPLLRKEKSKLLNQLLTEKGNYKTEKPGNPNEKGTELWILTQETIKEN